MSEAAEFGYHRSIGPILWVFVVLSSIELVVAHFLLSFWSPTAAVILSALTLLTVGWLIRLILSFRRLPVLAGEDGVTFRLGIMNSIHVPLAAITGVRREVRADDVRSRAVADFAWIEHPNVVLDISPAMKRGEREFRAATHKLDDPDGFARAVDALLRERRPG